MVCLDTNVVIAFGNGRLDPERLKGQEVIYPSVVRIEALGFTQILKAEERNILRFLDMLTRVELSQEVVDLTIDLRQLNKIGLADAIIAATAMAYEAELWTANRRDFKDITGLKHRNPLT